MNRPDLSGEKLIALDIETYDPGLVDSGPGVYRKDGYVLGFSLATESGFSEYYPIRHPETSDALRNANINYLRTVLALNVPKIGANIVYDLDWLVNGMGMPFRGTMHDIQMAEPILDEYAESYSLDTLAKKYLSNGKQKDEIAAYCENQGWTGSPQSHLWEMPASVVAEYAKADAVLPLKIFARQRIPLEEESLMPIYNMEISLIPLLLKMREVGVRIDRSRVEEGARYVIEARGKAREALWETYGSFNYNSSKQIAEVFDSLGISYGYTEKNNPMLGKDELGLIDHPIVESILKARESDKILGTFLNGAFVEYDVDGRIHSSFYNLRRDDGGTVSGRFSSQNPNLQQIPSRDETYGKICRRCFVPEEGCDWGKIDYSQIEYRVIANYAIGPRSEDIREQYRSNPKTDYHQLVMDWTGVDRTTAKRLNFGMAYFMGAESTARHNGWDIDYAKDLIALYFRTVPFMKPTRAQVVNVARGRGYIRTILGRRCRVSLDMIRNKKEYAMFNRLIQASAADIFKKQMAENWKAGVFNVLTPHIIVHDENGVSVPKTAEGREAYREMKHIMETCVTMKVPIAADAELGPSWGETEEVVEEAI